MAASTKGLYFGNGSGVMGYQEFYDELYQSAIDKGWQGWGGNDRLTKGWEQFNRIKGYIDRVGIRHVLELGCGEGHLCRLFAQQGYQVSGIDISAVAINWAIQKNHHEQTDIPYFCADLTDPSFTLQDNFDLIIDGNCLHCITGDQRKIFFSNVISLMETQGIFFVSSLCNKEPGNIITHQNGLPYRYIPDEKNLLDELKNAGFRLIKSQVHLRQQHNHISVVCSKPG